MGEVILDRISHYSMLVLEGCDGAGKSTLAMALERRHGFAVVHCSKTPDGVDLMARYRAILATPGRLTLDRSFVSEWVYGTVLRGMSRLSMSDILTMTDAVVERRGAFLYLWATTDCLEARLMTRDGAGGWDAEVASRLHGE